MLAPFFLALAGLASAHPASILDKRQSYVGTATFNDYSAQGNTNCGPKSGMRPVASLLSHRCRLRSWEFTDLFRTKRYLRRRCRRPVP